MEGDISYMNNAEGWNGKNPLFKKLIEETQPKIIVEVGSWKGQSTITMAQVVKELGLDTRIICIDTWLGALEFYTTPTPERDLMLKDGYPQVYYKFLENIKEHGVDDIITTIPLPSNLGLKYLISKGIQADLIYIDGSHEYDDVMNDIGYANQLNPKIMFGDDYNNSVFPGVKQAVDDFPLSNKEIIDNWYWVIRK